MSLATKHALMFTTSALLAVAASLLANSLSTASPFIPIWASVVLFLLSLIAQIIVSFCKQSREEEIIALQHETQTSYSRQQIRIAEATALQAEQAILEGRLDDFERLEDVRRRMLS